MTHVSAVLVEPSLFDDDWRESAKCRGMDPEMFFPHDAKDVAQAVDFCTGRADGLDCPVRGECLDAALAVSEANDWGICGGVSERGRRRLRQQLRVRRST